VPDLAISIVSYRTPALLRECLEALQEQRGGIHFEVTVVDNASGDGSAEMVAERFPWVRLIRNTTNRGFGAAHNQALGGSLARHLLVLNADAVVQHGALTTLVGYLDAHPDVGVVGPRLSYPDGRTQPSRRRFPTAATLFVESTQVQRFWPRNRILSRFYVEDRAHDEEQDVDWLVGACLCIRGQAAREVGLFDEGYFLYSEELDWCRRFKAAGWRVVYLPTAHVSHVEGASASQDLLRRDQHFQAGKLRYAARWHGPYVAFALRAYLVLEYLARGVEETLKMGLGSRVAERRGRLRVIRNGVRHALFH
jgi:N-acetylglucosaminyl-diphospho-decaprenol L-rhamnosyltransferase